MAQWKKLGKFWPRRRSFQGDCRSFVLVLWLRQSNKLKAAVMPRPLIRILPALIMMAVALPATARADDAAIEEIRAAWTQCNAILDAHTDDWVGWHHDVGGGYADNFEFWDKSFDHHPSVLKRSFWIDAVAFEEQNFCFRTDGTLAFVFTRMISPNMADGGYEGPLIAREGRIYVAPDGKIIRVLGQITQDGRKVSGLDDPKFELARGCWAIDLYRTTDAANEDYEATLGDIEGTHPAHQRNDYDWCAAVEN